MRGWGGFVSGAALDLPLAGGECVRQSGRHPQRLEPAIAALPQQRVQRGDGVFKSEVAAVTLHLQNIM